MLPVRRSSFILALFAALSIAPFAIASEATNWLMNTPASMMDWGSQKAAKDAERTAELLNGIMADRNKQDCDFYLESTIPESVKKKTLEDREEHPERYLKQYGFKYLGIAGYDQSKDQIEVGALVAPQFLCYIPGNRSQIDLNSCTGLIEDFRHYLLIYATTKDDGPLRSVVSWFSHNGGMPTNIANDLIKHTVIMIELDNYPNVDAKVTCEQPLAGGPVTSVVKDEK